MEPRRSRSAKWTNLPSDYTKQVVDALRESFRDEAKSGTFVVEGRIYADEILLSMGFLEKGRLRQTNFEISVDYKAGKEDTMKLLNLAMDVGATMLEELFASPSDADFPRTWQPFEVEGKILHLQFSATNTDLEKQADELLGKDSGRLVEGEDELGEEESLESIKRRLGVDDDE